MNGPLVGIIEGISSGNVDLIISELIVLVLLLLIAFPIHELAHAVVAKWLGDDTAERMGRITLNPVKHLDVVGTLLFLISGFGWAKPVPVNPYRLRGNWRWSFAIVALAGPTANLILATIFALLFRLLLPSSSSDVGNRTSIFLSAFVTAVSLNIFLALFNLIPVPPLDGSRLLTAILPNQGAALMDQIERYGFVILIALSATGLLSRIIVPPARVLIGTLLGA